MRMPRALFLGVLAAALAAAGSGAAKTYTVRKGDTLYELSHKFRVGVDDLKRANGLRSDVLRPGAKLKVPAKGASGKVAGARKGSQEKSRGEEHARGTAGKPSEARGEAGDKQELHTVKRGDTLIAIARAYGVDVKEIQRLNELKRKSVLRPGQKLVVGHGPAADPEETVQVRKGDTLNKISKRFHLSVAEIKELNGLRSDALRRGQTLFVARRAEPAPEAAVDEKVTECKLEDPKVDEDLTALSAEGAAAEGGVSDRLLRVAKRMLNIPYRFGGNSNRGIDCSAYVQKVFRFLNMSLPRTAREQYNLGSEVDRDQLVAGDLVFFRTYARYPSHVGIYIGDSQFIHASSKGRKVTIDSIDEPFYNKRFIGAKRLVQEGDAEPQPEATPQAMAEESAG